jgi:imidazolonepropionase-like amidohydrolase
MRRFIGAGVKFSMGTDAPTFLNFLQDDPNATELAYMVELGMSPMEAIIAGTRNGAEALGMLDLLGTIEEGKIADVIVLDGDPLKSMEAMKRIVIVVKDGIRYK